MMNLTRCQEELELLGFSLELSDKYVESWSHPDTGSATIYYFRNPREKEYFVKLKGFNKFSELRAVQERLEELNDSIRPVYINGIHYVHDEFSHFYMIRPSCHHVFVVRYPDNPCSITECPECHRPLDWDTYSHPDWWKEDNNEQS